MKLKLFILKISLLLFLKSNATVDYLVVNRITKQLYWADTDSPAGFIGWTNIPDGSLNIKEQKYLGKGYRFTNNPYLIEEIGLGFGVIILIGLWFYKKRNTNPALEKPTSAPSR